MTRFAELFAVEVVTNVFVPRARRMLNRGVEPWRVAAMLAMSAEWPGPAGGVFVCSDTARRTVTIHGLGLSITIRQSWWSRMLRRRGRRA